jgi:hypothetical protein
MYANDDVLLITKEDIFKYTQLSGNFDVDKITPFIKIAQDIQVQELCGTVLYRRLQMRVSFVIHPRIHSCQARRNWTPLSKDKETLPKLIGGVALITFRISHRGTQNTPPTNKRENTQIVIRRISLHGICKKDI